MIFTDEEGNKWEEAGPGEMVPYSGRCIPHLEEGWKLMKPVKKTEKKDALNAYYLGKLNEIIILARKLSIISQDELFKEFVVTLDREAAALQYVLKGVTMGEDEQKTGEEA